MIFFTLYGRAHSTPFSQSPLLDQICIDLSRDDKGTRRNTRRIVSFSRDSKTRNFIHLVSPLILLDDTCSILIHQQPSKRTSRFNPSVLSSSSPFHLTPRVDKVSSMLSIFSCLLKGRPKGQGTLETRIFGFRYFSSFFFASSSSLPLWSALEIRYLRPVTSNYYRLSASNWCSIEKKKTHRELETNLDFPFPL